MGVCPCKNCERKGCGSYHDQCEPYQVYRRNNIRRNVLTQKENRTTEALLAIKINGKAIKNHKRRTMKE